MNLFEEIFLSSVFECRKEFDTLMRINKLTSAKSSEIFSKLSDKYGMDVLVIAMYLLLVRFYKLVGEAKPED